MTQVSIDQLVTRALDLSDRAAPGVNAPLANSKEVSDQSFEDHLSAVQPNEDRPAKAEHQEKTPQKQLNSEDASKEQLATEKYTSVSNEQVQIDEGALVPSEEVLVEQEQIELVPAVAVEVRDDEFLGAETDAEQVVVVDQVAIEQHVAEEVVVEQTGAEKPAIEQIVSEHVPGVAGHASTESASDNSVGNVEHTNIDATESAGQSDNQSERSNQQQTHVETAKEVAASDSDNQTQNVVQPTQKDAALPSQQRVETVAQQPSQEPVPSNVHTADSSNPVKDAQQALPPAEVSLTSQPEAAEQGRQTQPNAKLSQQPTGSESNHQQAAQGGIALPDQVSPLATDQQTEAAIQVAPPSKEVEAETSRTKSVDKQARKKLAEKVEADAPQQSTKQTQPTPATPAVTVAETALPSPETLGNESRNAPPQPPQSLSLTPTDAGQSRMTPAVQPSSSGQPESRQPITEAQQARFVQRVAGAFQSARHGDGELRIRLHPPELGSLRMQIKVEDGVMVARLETETQTARNLLLDNLPALRERLAGQDIRIERFDVDVQDQSAGNRQQQATGQGNTSEHGHEHPAASRQQYEHADEAAADEPVSQRELVDDSSLNVVI